MIKHLYMLWMGMDVPLATATATATATVTATTTNKQELWVKVDEEGCGKGQKPADNSLEVLNQFHLKYLRDIFALPCVAVGHATIN